MSSDPVETAVSLCETCVRLLLLPEKGSSTTASSSSLLGDPARTTHSLKRHMLKTKFWNESSANCSVVARGKGGRSSSPSRERRD